MVQPFMQDEAIGKKRTGPNRGGKQQKYFLSDQGRTMLLNCYDGTKDNISMLEQRLGVPRRMVTKWARQLGLGRTKEPRWTEQDEHYLESNIHKMSIADIASKLGRTRIAVRLKAKRLGVNKTQEGYTLRGLMLGLGISNDQKIKDWVSKGWIRAGRRKTERPKEIDFWYFSDGSIRKFITEHPEEIDQRKVDWLWVVDILTGGLGELGDKVRGEK